MELLSNLVWLAVSISLWGLWLWRRRGGRKGSLVPGVGLQIVALAMLTAVLLPPISLTDDLHSCQLPAEIKRTVVRSDRPLAPVAPPGVLPFLFALGAFCLSLPGLRTVSFLTREELPPRQSRGHHLSLWSRPPPALAV